MRKKCYHCEKITSRIKKIRGADSYIWVCYDCLDEWERSTEDAINDQISRNIIQLNEVPSILAQTDYNS